MSSSDDKTFYEQQVDKLYSEISLHPKQYLLVRQSKAFMQRHHAQRLELDDLAKAAFMSRFHYVRIFKQIYGITPRNYLRDMRIEKAKQLLKQGHSVTHTSLEVGYESFTTFSTVFKKCTGHSPREYQKRNQALTK